MPASVLWTMRDGSEQYACGDCNPGGVEARPVSPAERPAVLTVPEAAAYLRCSDETIRRRVRSGEIEALPRSGPTAPIRIRLSVLEALRAASTPPRVAPVPRARTDSGSVEWPS
jgi:excisionase family DNA binding protein